MLSCRFENGNTTTNLRHVTTDVIVLNENDEVLLSRRAPQLNHGGKWGLIGGYVDRDERVAEAAVREVWEETGYELQLEFLLSIIDLPDRGEDRQNIMFLFVGRAGEKLGKPDQESTQQQWFSLDALPPVSEFAFDHRACLEAYRKFRKQPTPLPLVFDGRS